MVPMGDRDILQLEKQIFLRIRNASLRMQFSFICCDFVSMLAVKQGDEFAVSNL